MFTMNILTLDSLKKIMKEIKVDEPILQVLGYKKLPRFVKDGIVGSDRYRLLVSDGKNMNSYIMLASQLNHLIENNILTEYAICKVLNYRMSPVNNNDTENYLILITGIEVIVPGDKIRYKIGDPVLINTKLDREE